MPAPVARDRLELVCSLLAPGALRAAFQPIVRLGDESVIGYEALVRVDDSDCAGPEDLLNLASSVGLRAEAELACWAAVAAAGPPPGRQLVFVNVSPAVLGHPGFLAMADALPRALVLELTEREAVTDFQWLHERLEPWAARGVLVAVDDVGAGHAAIEHVVELRPQFIKVARQLVSGLDRDSHRRAMVRAIRGFARDSGASLIAEGVEREAELEALRELGVECVQGFLLGHPSPPWTGVSSAGSASAARSRAGTARPGAGAGTTIAAELATAPDVPSACRLVVEHFARHDMLLASLYLARGGVLRCQAVRRYWQIFDGMEPGGSVIGEVFRTGREAVVTDTARSADYLEAAPEVTAEICVPLVSGGEVVGAVNVESPVEIPPAILHDLRAAAALLGERIGELGGVPAESRPNRLARHAASLAGLADAAAIERRVVEAACDVGGLESALIAVTVPGRGLEVRAAHGPLAGALCELSTQTLCVAAGWVASVASAYTIGEPGGRGFVGHEALRAAGAEALVVLPLVGPEGRSGIIVLADRRPVALSTDDVELLELLAAHAASCLRTAEAIASLSERAATDPLTGLGHHATFHAALGATREALAPHASLAVVLADVDGFKQINDGRGHLAGDRVLRQVAAALHRGLRVSDRLFRIGGDEFAALVEVDSTAEVMRVGRRLLQAIRALDGVSVSIGVAVAHPFEIDAALLARADEALYRVKRRGRDDLELAEAPAQATLWEAQEA